MQIKKNIFNHNEAVVPPQSPPQHTPTRRLQAAIWLGDDRSCAEVDGHDARSCGLE